MKKILIIISLVLLASCSGKKEVTQYTIDQFYKNVNTGLSAFSPDETRVLVSSNETGIYNVFEINIADGSKRQVTGRTNSARRVLSRAGSSRPTRCPIH